MLRQSAAEQPPTAANHCHGRSTEALIQSRYAARAVHVEALAMAWPDKANGGQVRLHMITASKPIVLIASH